MLFCSNNLLAQGNLEIRFGGLTFEDIYNDCDSIKYASIADKEIYLYDTVLKKRYDIDSMEVVEIYPFGEVIGYQVKGNKFPKKVVYNLYIYKRGLGILLNKIYYKDGKEIIEIENDHILQIWVESHCDMLRGKLK
jgi:hypothetical protein